MLIGAYLVLCLAIGFAGRRRRLGFIGYFLLSVMVTPIVMLIFLLASRWDQKRSARVHAHVCPECEKEASPNVRHCPSCGRAV